MQLRYPRSKLFLILPPRHPVHPSRCLAPELVETLRQQGRGEMVEQCRELLAPVLPGALAYAFGTHRRTSPALRPACGSILSIPCGYSASLHHLLRAAPFVRRLPRYYGNIRLLSGVDGGITVALPRPARRCSGGHR